MRFVFALLTIVGLTSAVARNAYALSWSESALGPSQQSCVSANCGLSSGYMLDSFNHFWWYNYSTSEWDEGDSVDQFFYITTDLNGHPWVIQGPGTEDCPDGGGYISYGTVTYNSETKAYTWTFTALESVPTCQSAVAVGNACLPDSEPGCTDANIWSIDGAGSAAHQWDPSTSSFGSGVGPSSPSQIAVFVETNCLDQNDVYVASGSTIFEDDISNPFGFGCHNYGFGALDKVEYSWPNGFGSDSGNGYSVLQADVALTPDGVYQLSDGFWYQITATPCGTGSDSAVAFGSGFDGTWCIDALDQEYWYMSLSP
jgi:hypothetical protein